MDSNNKPIRILHVLGSLNRGGAETMIINIYRNIDKSKIQFDFIIHTGEKCDYTNEIISMGGKIFSMKKFRGYNCLSYVKQFHEFFSSYPEYRVIHGHMRSTASLYLLVAKKHKLYTISHSHNTSSGKGVSAIVKNIMQFPLRYIADYYFACSKEAGEWLFGERIVESNKFSILKNGIDIKKFIYNDDIRDKKRKELGITNEFVIGNVARFHEQKNHNFLINIFYEFLKMNSNSLLILVGEGKIKENIKLKVRKLNIDQRVIFLDSRNDINELMQAFDVFLFPSKYEGLGIVAIEAQCASLPVICSNHVPIEVKISGNIEFLPIDNVDIWLERLFRINKKIMRYTNNNLFESGYDIHTISTFLSDFYEKRW